MLQPHEALVACCCARSLCAVSTALATTYVRVEKDGTKTYSDRPIPGGSPSTCSPRRATRRPLRRESSSASSRDSRKPTISATRAAPSRRRTIRRSRIRRSVPIAAGARTRRCVPAIRDHDGRRSVRGRSQSTLSYTMIAGESRHAYRVGNRDRPVRQGGVQRRIRRSTSCVPG